MPATKTLGNEAGFAIAVNGETVWVGATALTDSAGTEYTAANPIPIGPGALPAGTDRSGSIAAGAAAQVLAAALATRKGLKGQNISAGDLWINEIGGTAAADTAGSWRVQPGQTFCVSTNRAISIIGATTGQKFTATEY